MSAPLIVAATAAEAKYVPASVCLLITGIGKVNAAAVVAEYLARQEVLPSVIVNIGTAGAVKSGLRGLVLPSRVINHDISADAIRTLGYEVIDSLDIAGGDGTVVATGDVFVTDPEARDALAHRADLVEMEAFAIAYVASRFGVPCRLVKVISDDADETAWDWTEALDGTARVLADWIAEHPGG